MKKYKVLMITTGFAPYEFSEAIVNSKLVLALKDAGHQVDVISRQSKQVYTVGWSEIWKPLQSITHFVSEKKVNHLKRYLELLHALLFFKYPINGIRWGHKAYRLAIALYKINHYDILLTRMPSMIPHLIGVKLHNKFKIPWIANWNDPTDNIRPNHDNRSIISNLVTNSLVRNTFINADINTFPAKELWTRYNSMILHLSSDVKVEIIPHISLNKSINNESYNITSNEFTLCHAGNIFSNVNAEPFLNALSRFKQCDGIAFKLHMFGLIEDTFLQEAERSGIYDNIVYHGSYSYEYIISELRKYDVLIIIEAQYDTGILLLSKLSDYALIGKPILCVSPKEGVIPEYIKNYGGGLSVNNKDSMSIYNGLKIMYEGWSHKWSRNVTFSADEIYNQFKPENIINQYFKVFNKLKK